jgi:hypothetical protein
MLARVEPTNSSAGGRSIMTAFVDVRFRGLRVAHKAKLLDNETGVFVEHEAPLPVGSMLSVIEEGKEPRSARVVRVVEHEAGAGAPGMRVVWDLAAVVAAPAPVPVETSGPAEVSGPADVSSDASVDGSEDGGADRSADTSAETPLGGNGTAKKSKKNKKRR